MASEIVRESFPYKKFLDRQYTLPDDGAIKKAWYEEYPGEFHYVSKNVVWTDDVPGVPPLISTPVVEVHNTLTLTEDFTTPNHLTWWSVVGTRIRGWINPLFGHGYTVRVFDNGSVEIPSSDPVNWQFDYSDGILSFESNPVTAGYASPFKIKAYRYIGTTLGSISAKTYVHTELAPGAATWSVNHGMGMNPISISVYSDTWEPSMFSSFTILDLDNVQVTFLHNFYGRMVIFF